VVDFYGAASALRPKDIGGFRSDVCTMLARAPVAHTTIASRKENHAYSRPEANRPDHDEETHAAGRPFYGADAVCCLRLAAHGHPSTERWLRPRQLAVLIGALPYKSTYLGYGETAVGEGKGSVRVTATVSR
jgi:hypothetical protein